MDITTRKIDRAELETIKDSSPVPVRERSVRDLIYTDLLIETVNEKGDVVASKTIPVLRKFAGTVVVQIEGDKLKEVGEASIKEGIAKAIESDVTKKVLFVACDPALTVRVTDLSPTVDLTELVFVEGDDPSTPDVIEDGFWTRVLKFLRIKR